MPSLHVQTDLGMRLYQDCIFLRGAKVLFISVSPFMLHFIVMLNLSISENIPSAYFFTRKYAQTR